MSTDPPPFVWVIVDELGAIDPEVFSTPRTAELYVKELNGLSGPETKKVRYRLDPE